MVFKVFRTLFIALWICKLLIHFFLIYLLILKTLTEALLGHPFSVIGWCFPMSNLHWLHGKCARFTCNRRLPRYEFKFTEPQETYYIHFRGLYSLWRGVTERIFYNYKISKYGNFKIASLNFKVDFFDNKGIKNWKNHQRIYRKYLLVIKPSKNINLMTKSL